MCAREKTINMTSKYKSSTEYHIKLSNTIGSELRIGLPKSGLLKKDYIGSIKFTTPEIK